MEVYFTFPDGALSYDCAACGQRCCRGAGFAFGADELVPLLTRAPSLSAHLSLRAGGTFHAADLTERCWLLDGAGLCELEVKHGRDAKPSTCRLFPFNRVYRVGDVRVVDVNSALCPVEPAGGDGVRHEALRRDLDALAGSPLIDVPAKLPDGLAADWLARERRIAEAACAGSDPSSLAAAAGDDATDVPAAAWARVYGLAADALEPLERAVAPRVALLYPSLRFGALFAGGGASYALTVERLPRRLRALTFLGALATRSLGAPPSLRGLTELARAQAPILDVLERWTTIVKLAAPQFSADVAPALQAPLAILLGGAFRGGRTVGELVESAAAALPVEQRPLAVALAAKQLPTLLPV
jgi:hypothetical protein